MKALTTTIQVKHLKALVKAANQLQIGREKGFSKSSNLNDGYLSYQESWLRKFKNHLNQNKYVYSGLGVVTILVLIGLLS